MRMRTVFVAALIGLAASPAMADLIVSIVPDYQEIYVDPLPGATTVDIVADIPEADAIIGFGLDLDISGDAVSIVGVAIGAGFDAVYAPDGDELAGLVQPPGTVWGQGVVLASISVSLDAYGTAYLSPGYTVGDPFEGFVGPGGVVGVAEWLDGTIVVIPEPAALTLLALGGLALIRRR